jgi:hypothetical protein
LCPSSGRLATDWSAGLIKRRKIVQAKLGRDLFAFALKAALLTPEHLDLGREQGRGIGSLNCARACVRLPILRLRSLAARACMGIA